MQFDELFEHIGHIGLYQAVVSCMLCLFSLFGIESVSIIFLGAYSSHWCSVPALANFSHDQQKYISVPYNEDGEYDECYMFDLDYDGYSTDELINWNRTLFSNDSTRSCDEGWIFDQTDFVSTINSRFDLVCDRSWLNFLSSSLFMLGVLIGSVFCGPMADKVGRKPTIMMFVVMKLVANVISTVAPVYWVFATARLFIGMGTTGAYLVAFVLVLELVGPLYRTVFGVGFQMAFSLGFMACVGFSYAIRDDRYLQIVITIPPLVFLAYFWIIPESPRWLIVTKRYDKAMDVIRHIAQVNQQALPDDLQEKLEDIEEDEEPSSANVLDLFKTPRLRLWTLIVLLHWFVDSLMYYALTLNVGALPGDIFINSAVSAAIEIPAHFLCIFFMNWAPTGRRITTAVSMLLAGIFSFMVIPFITNDNEIGQTSMSLVGKLFVVISFSAIYVYSTEIFPTEVRNTGMGTASFVARISGILAPFVGGPLADVWAPLPSVIFGVCGTIGGIASFWLPETLNTDMFETVTQAENFQKPSSSTSNNGKVLPQNTQEGVTTYNNDAYDSTTHL